MQVVTETLHGEGFEPQVTAHRADDQVVVVGFGRVIAQWSEADPVARDLFIAAALRIGWRGKTVAALSFSLPSYVSRVRSRVAEGGFAALAQRSQGGRPSTLTLVQRRRALRLRREGLALAPIAAKLGVALSTLGRALQGVGAGPGATQEALALAASTTDTVQEPAPCDDGATCAPSTPRAPIEPVEPVEPVEPEAPRAGDALAPDGAPHACRYAGTVLVAAAVQALGLDAVLAGASVQRPAKAIYAARQVVVAMSAAWASGHPSIESMHERDPFALGVVLGLARSPSVRTLHRAMVQMTAQLDPIQWWAGWMTELMRRCAPTIPVFGVDGHFKPYAGDAPIDKGWNTKRRLAERGLMTVRVNDLRGQTWSEVTVPAGDSLHAHVLGIAQALCEAQALDEGAVERPVLLAFDRGGFSFPVLNALGAQGAWYLAWVPATVTLPDLTTIAPADDGVGEQLWTHPSLTHPSRLLVERDGAVLVPATTNLPPWIDAATAMGLLRGTRGMQENAIKAARAFAHIDRLSDRGAHSLRPDDRPIDNPERRRLKGRRKALQGAWVELVQESPRDAERAQKDIDLDRLVNEVHQHVVAEQLASTPCKVARTSVDPEAQRAELKVRNRQLLLPLKNALENGRRWLLEALGEGLAPTDHAWDQDTRLRTLTALLRAPGRVRLHPDRVEVEVDLPLAPTAHRRLSAALARLDDRGLCFTDGSRAVHFRLAPRPARS